MSASVALALVVALIAANAIFVAAEFALVAARRGAIEELAATGDRRARTAAGELHRLSFVLSAAQFGITVTSLLVGFLAEDAVGGVVVTPVVDVLGLPSGTERLVTVAAAFLLSTGFQMVVGELAPKNIAIARPDRVALAVAPLMRLFGLVFGPVIRVFDAAAGWVTEHLFGVGVQDELAAGHTLDDLSRIIAASTQEGALSGEQAMLLARAVELGDRRVTEVMVPAPDVLWLDRDQPAEDLRAMSRRTGHSRFPVRHGDEVVGTVHVKDLLGIDAGGATVGDLSTPAMLVPESEPLRRLLARFRSEQRTFAIVLDEYGSVAGIATVEDVLEQLVGDIEDEFDRTAAPAIRRLGRGRYRMSGTVRLDRFAGAVGLVLPNGDYETIAGFVMDRLGHIPDVGETVDHQGIRLVVTAMEGVRVAEVDVVQGPPDGATGAGPS